MMIHLRSIFLMSGRSLKINDCHTRIQINSCGVNIPGTDPVPCCHRGHTPVSAFPSMFDSGKLHSLFTMGKILSIIILVHSCLLILEENSRETV